MIAVALTAIALATASPDRARCEALVALDGPPCEDRIATCERVGAIAREMGVSVALVTALAYHEARYDPEPPRMCSTLQVSPRTWCPWCSHRECERVGVRVLGLLLEQERARGPGCYQRRALRRWLRGPHGWRGIDERGERWIGAVLRTAAGEDR